MGMGRLAKELLIHCYSLGDDFIFLNIIYMLIGIVYFNSQASEDKATLDNFVGSILLFWLYDWF